MTFRESAAKALEANRAKWRNPKTAAAWTASLDRYASGIMDRPVNEIGREDVLGILSPIWNVKPEEGRKLRTRLRATFAWAQAHNLRADNPASEAIGAALPSTKSTLTRHFRALPHADVAASLAVIDASRASLVTRACLRFVVLTACRSGEARLAKWGEIDLAGRVWVIPATRTKMNREHRVPLSDAAIETLRRVLPLRRDDDLVFPSPAKPGAALSDMALVKLLRECEIDCVPHGFRSSFRCWCADTGKPREVAEAALAHVVRGVEGAYQRSSMLDRRRELMDAWGGYMSRK